MIPRYAVITTFNRPQVALDCIESIGTDADVVLVIDNGDNEPMPFCSDERSLTSYYVVQYPMQPVNLSHLWNMGLEWVAADARLHDLPEWDVAIFNDDALVPAGWMQRVQEGLRTYDAAAACTGPVQAFLKEAVAVPLYMRMTGWAFMLRGEGGLRLDEQFEWWYGDSDLDWRAREAGGMLMLPGGAPDNRFPNGFTSGERLAQVAVDAQRFQDKWQRPAW